MQDRKRNVRVCACPPAPQVRSPSGVHRGSLHLTPTDDITAFNTMGVSNDGKLAFLTTDRSRYPLYVATRVSYVMSEILLHMSGSRAQRMTKCAAAQLQKSLAGKQPSR
jgi:hypothetical protein